ncbi:hypothetical protein ACF09E_11585 [Streptomyces sp. NPDC014891]|uniref:hypothetical protein n=1 Tax=Streptomyces sp. NPDC014891 TaxID=3364929 RepID=UPI0036FF6669
MPPPGGFRRNDPPGADGLADPSDGFGTTEASEGAEAPGPFDAPRPFGAPGPFVAGMPHPRLPDASPGTDDPRPVETGSDWFGTGPGALTPGPAADPRPGRSDPAPDRPTGPPRPGAARGFAERHPSHLPPPLASPRPAPARGDFRPLTIRTARDAVAAAAGYLRWLGFRDVVQPEERPAAGVDLRAPGLVAQVDPSTRPTGLRAVECLWLNGLSASAVSVFFSLAGYTPEARSRAAELGLPLFVLDLTGTPQPVNAAAEGLTSGAA